MSTIDGIKAAYKWEWGDKTRRHNGGRITTQQFLDLEAGIYGEVAAVNFFDVAIFGAVTAQHAVAAVNVLDFQWYLDLKTGDNPYMTALVAAHDPLLRFRLGPKSYDYLMKHERIAKAFHAEERPNDGYGWSRGYDDRVHPYITEVQYASNCPYRRVNERFRQLTGKWVWEPRIPEGGYALAHLLDIDGFMRTHTAEVGVMLMSAPDVHEWWNGAKFVAVPEGASLKKGVAQGPDADKLLRSHWEHFMEPVDEGYEPIQPFLLERAGKEWFACYPKKFPNDECMDSGDFEFHVRAAKRIGREVSFMRDDDFFLRYSLSQVRNMMPTGANAYQVVDVSPKDSRGLTEVTVQFYFADVDLTRRLPRSEELARDYDRLMEVYTR